MRNAYGPFWCLAMLPNKMTCFLAHMQTSRKIVHGPYAILEIRGNTFEENSFYGCPPQILTHNPVALLATPLLSNVHHRAGGHLCGHLE